MATHTIRYLRITGNFLIVPKTDLDQPAESSCWSFHDKRHPRLRTLLSYVAACTERVGLGTSVLVLPYHNPIRLAKSLSVSHWGTRRLVAMHWGRRHTLSYRRSRRLPMSACTRSSSPAIPAMSQRPFRPWRCWHGRCCRCASSAGVSSRADRPAEISVPITLEEMAYSCKQVSHQSYLISAGVVLGVQRPGLCDLRPTLEERIRESREWISTRSSGRFSPYSNPKDACPIAL